MSNKISAQFPSRREAEIAVEHLVQEHEIKRTDIFIEPASSDNSAGAKPSGGDAAVGDPSVNTADDAALNSPIVVSIDLNSGEPTRVVATLEEAGAIDVSTQ